MSVPEPRGRVGRFLRRSAKELALDARGDVVELGALAPGVYPAAVRSLQRLEDPAEVGSVRGADTICSVGSLWRAEWTADRIEALVAALRADGLLLFAEPVAVVGVSGRVQRVVGPVSVRTLGVAFDRPLVDDLRRSGLVVTSVVRTSLDPVGRVRTVAVGRAVRR